MLHLAAHPFGQSWHWIQIQLIENRGGNWKYGENAISVRGAMLFESPKANMIKIKFCIKFI